MLMNISTGWWENLDGAGQAFWGIAIVFSVLFVIQFILSLIGLDFDAEAGLDFSTETDAVSDSEVSLETEFSIFSVRSIIAFFMLFGWTGVLLLDAGFSVWLALIAAGIVGFLAMIMVAYLMFRISRMDESGTFNTRTAINNFGEVYLTIPATKTGYGKIHLKIKGSTREMDAVTDHPEQIPNGSRVKIIDVLDDNLLLVEKINK